MVLNKTFARCNLLV